MHGRDAVNLAAGAILVGIGAVILGLLSPTAAAAVGSVCAVLGLYLIVGGVYLGRWTPATAVERAFRPNLADPEAKILSTEDNDVVFQFAVHNSGRSNLEDANLNVVVPGTVAELARCSGVGEVGLEEHKGAFTAPAPERFWHGNVTFPGRMVRVVYFRATLSALKDFHVQVKVFAPELDDTFDWGFDLGVEAFMRQRPTPAPEVFLCPLELHAGVAQRIAHAENIS